MQLVIETQKLKALIRNQKVQGTFVFGPLFSKWIGVFQSFLDLIEGCAFIQNIHFFIFSSLFMLVSTCYNF